MGFCFVSMNHIRFLVQVCSILACRLRYRLWTTCAVRPMCSCFKTTTSICLMLSDDTMLTHWKKSITGRRLKSSAPSDVNTGADTAAGGNDVQMVVCKLCLTACHSEQMYILEQCHCSFCLEVNLCDFVMYRSHLIFFAALTVFVYCLPYS